MTISTGTAENGLSSGVSLTTGAAVRSGDIVIASGDATEVAGDISLEVGNGGIAAGGFLLQSAGSGSIGGGISVSAGGGNVGSGGSVVVESGPSLDTSSSSGSLTAATVASMGGSGNVVLSTGEQEIKQIHVFIPFWGLRLIVVSAQAMSLVHLQKVALCLSLQVIQQRAAQAT